MIKSIILCLFSIFFIYGLINFMCTLKYPKTTYIIKALNNQDTIEAKLRLKLMRNCEIVVIDSGSTDDTKKIIKKMIQDYPCISLIEKEQC